MILHTVHVQWMVVIRHNKISKLTTSQQIVKTYQSYNKIKYYESINWNNLFYKKKIISNFPVKRNE